MMVGKIALNDLEKVKTIFFGPHQLDGLLSPAERPEQKANLFQ